MTDTAKTSVSNSLQQQIYGTFMLTLSVTVCGVFFPHINLHRMQDGNYSQPVQRHLTGKLSEMYHVWKTLLGPLIICSASVHLLVHVDFDNKDVLSTTTPPAGRRRDRVMLGTIILRKFVSE